MITTTRRIAICLAILGSSLAAQEALEWSTPADRPLLSRELATIPAILGDWVGTDIPQDPAVLRESQADDWLNRMYENRLNPEWKISVWINYSTRGLNLRHSPEICLPSGGWTKSESKSTVMEVSPQAGNPTKLSRLVYTQGEVSQTIGFWYYIFGEGSLEQFVRGLPITSRSSHGRTTRGSGMTVELFCPGDSDPESEALRSFAPVLVDALEGFLPQRRAEYHVP